MTTEYELDSPAIELSDFALERWESVVAEACIIWRHLDCEGPGSPETDDEARKRRRQQYRILDSASWRWKRAQREARRVGDRRYVDDDICNQIANFFIIEMGGRVASHIDTDNFRSWSQCFRRARDLYGSPIDRLIVEALVLAGIPSAEIAAEMGIDADVVALYELAFFDAREILSARGAIMCYVIDFRSNPDKCPMRSELLRVAYFGGRVAAMGVVDYLRHLHEDHDLTTQMGNQRRQIELLVRSRERFVFSRMPGSISPSTFLPGTTKEWLTLPTVADLIQARVHNSSVDLPSEQHYSTEPLDRYEFGHLATQGTKSA